MNSRPLLDYLADPDDSAESTPGTAPAADERPVDAIESRLKDLEARLRAGIPAAPAPIPAPKQDLTLSAQVEAILKRKPNPLPVAPAAGQPMRPAEAVEPAPRPARIVVEPPPTVPAIAAAPAVDPEFQKFTEAVYLMGQAARRFIEQPQPVSAPERAAPASPSIGEIEALSAVLRETVSAFRSVADDLAVSVGEIRKMATRDERSDPVERASRPRARDESLEVDDLRQAVSDIRSVASDLAASVGEIRHRATRDDRPAPSRRASVPILREDDEILELRDTVADLQDRLDMLLHARRRARY